MNRPALVLLCLAVAALQMALWWAAESRDVPARQMASRLGQAQGQVTAGAGELLDGRSRYVVRFRYEAEGQSLEGVEYLSLRQKQLPQAGQAVTVYFDRQTPDFSSLSDPRLTLHRIATMKVLIVGFGIFTYAFIGAIWKASSGSNP